EGRQELPDFIHHLDGVGARLALYGEHDAALALEPGGKLVVLHAIDDAPEFLQAHWRAVAISDDHRAEGGRVLQLPARLHREYAVLAVERAGRQVDVRLRHRLLDLVDADAARGERV